MTSLADDDPGVEFSSPDCSMHDADASYMGYAGKDEATAFLNELLEPNAPGRGSRSRAPGRPAAARSLN